MPTLDEHRETFQQALEKARAGIAQLEEECGTGARAGEVTRDNSQESGMHDAAWPELKEEALIGVVGRMVRTILPTTEADLVGLLVHLLSEFSCAIGRGPHIQLDGGYSPLSFWPVLVGKTSNSRKGSSAKRIERLVRAAIPDWDRGEYRGNLSSGEGLAFAVRDPVYKIEPIKGKGQPAGKTVEVLVDQGVKDKRLYLVQAEFGAMLRVMQREGNSLSGVLRDSWDGEDLRPMTKANRIRATEPHIVVVGHVTKEELTRNLNDTEMANGFGNRFVWFVVKRSKPIAFSMNPDPATLAPIIADLRKAVSYARNTKEIGMTEEARQDWIKIYPALSDEKHGLSGSLLGRAEAQTRRLAALYALLDCRDTVNLEALHAAVALWDYAVASVKWIFGDYAGYAVADTILQALRTRGGLSDTDISNLFGRNVSAGKLAQAKTFLQAGGKIHRKEEETGGRHKVKWHVGMN